MLILTRKLGESVYIGDLIKVTFVELKGAQVRIGIDAPKGIRIYREEIYLQILEENKSAAEAAMTSDDDLALLEGSLAGSGGLGSKFRAFESGRSKGGAGESASKQPQVVVKRKKGKKTDEQ